jgi:hypothetical protein
MCSALISNLPGSRLMGLKIFVQGAKCAIVTAQRLEAMEVLLNI